MTSAVTICNLALAHIGAAQQVMSIDPPDGGVLAGFCARFYPHARREMLEHPWRFARRRTALVLHAEGPPPGWLFAYALPAGCIAPKRIVAPFPATPLPWSMDSDLYWLPRFDNGAGAPFEVEGQRLFTNQPNAVLLHTVDVTDTSVYTPGFVSSLALRLAGYLAGSVIKGRDGLQARDRLHQEARALAEMHLARDANAGQEGRHPLPDTVAARL